MPGTEKGAGSSEPTPFVQAPWRWPRACRRPSDPADGVGLAAAVASRRGLELHAVTLLQSPEAVHLDRAVVDEDVRPTVGGDEAEALLRVEPLDRALSHGTSMLPVLLHVVRSDPADATPDGGAGRSGRMGGVPHPPPFAPAARRTRSVDEHRAAVAALLAPMPAERVPLVAAR